MVALMPLPGTLLAAPTLLFLLHGVCCALAQLWEAEYQIVHTNSFKLFAIPSPEVLDSMTLS